MSKIWVWLIVLCHGQFPGTTTGGNWGWVLSTFLYYFYNFLWVYHYLKKFFKTTNQIYQYQWLKHLFCYFKNIFY